MHRCRTFQGKPTSHVFLQNTWKRKNPIHRVQSLWKVFLCNQKVVLTAFILARVAGNTVVLKGVLRISFSLCFEPRTLLLKLVTVLYIAISLFFLGTAALWMPGVVCRLLLELNEMWFSGNKSSSIRRPLPYSLPFCFSPQAFIESISKSFPFLPLTCLTWDQMHCTRKWMTASLPVHGYGRFLF